MIDHLNALLAATICVVILSLLFGFSFGRITAPKPRGPLARFKLTDAQLTLIAYEASRAYRIAHGDLSAKSFNNLPRQLRAALVDRIAAYRRRPVGVADRSRCSTRSRARCSLTKAS
jgi:hypothetical protein